MVATAGSLCNTYDNPYLQTFAGDKLQVTRFTQTCIDICQQCAELQLAGFTQTAPTSVSRRAGFARNRCHSTGQSARSLQLPCQKTLSSACRFPDWSRAFLAWTSSSKVRTPGSKLSIHGSGTDTCRDFSGRNSTD